MQLEAIKQMIEIMNKSGKSFSVQIGNYLLLPVAAKKSDGLTFLVKMNEL